MLASTGEGRNDLAIPGRPRPRGEEALMRPRTGRGRPAATTVEFALVSMVFLSIVLGIIEVGRGLMVDYLLRHTARQACRVAVPAGRSNTDVQAEVDAALTRNGLPDTDATVKVNGVVADVGTA